MATTYELVPYAKTARAQAKPGDAPSMYYVFVCNVFKAVYMIVAAAIRF